MPKLILTDSGGKRRSALLLSAANAQRPNEIQMRQLEQINRRLSPEVLAELSTRRLVIPPQEFGLLLSRLKAATDLNISVGD